jgi:hypothetical protein
MEDGMKRWLAVAALGLALAGCADPYGACVKAGANIATSISGANQTVVTLETGGLISPAEEINVLGYLKFVNDTDGAFLACASAAHTAGNKPGTYTACAQTFSTSLANPQELALIKVSNPAAADQIQAVVTAVNAAVTAVTAALGGA